MLFQADVGPLQSVHDRACELYQQLIGIIPLKERAGLSADDCGPALARQVYGEEHFDQCHDGYQTFYKPRYLRSVNNDKIYAFPHGVPCGWSKHKKLHFIAHSMGAQTVRHLQYLMSIDYFKDGTGADWFASVTCLSGCINGVPSVHSTPISQKTLMPELHKNGQLTFKILISVGITLSYL